MNDLSSILQHCGYQLYADDTVLYLSGELNDITNNIIQDLSNFKLWCTRNKLTLNVSTTKYVTFGLKSQTKKIRDHHVHIDDLQIDHVSSYKYLGVTLDMNLTYTKHLQNCLSIATHKAYLLSKIRTYISSDAAVRIYKTMILPIIEYGIFCMTIVIQSCWLNYKHYRIDVSESVMQNLSMYL